MANIIKITRIFQVRQWAGQGVLTAPDQFVLCVGEVPRIKTRVEAMATMLFFDRKLAELLPDLRCLVQCMRELQASAQFRVVLEGLLNLGNYCNGGASQGGAAGFRLQLLDKALEIQSYDPQVSLLHYLVLHLRERRPQGPCWATEVPSLLRAGKVSVDAIDSNMRDLQRMLSTAQV
jgi:hypothetical protein